MPTPAVDPSLPSDPRSLAALAAYRGWLDAGAVFDAGRRCERLGPTAPLADVLGPALSPEQIAMLSAPLPSDTLASAAIPFTQTTRVNQDLSDGTQPVQLRPLDSESAALERSLEAPAAAGSRYVFGGSLGEGGMGTVTAALDRETGRTIAIKTLRADMAGDRTIARRFLHEARITAQLEHPAVIPVHEMGALARRPPVLRDADREATVFTRGAGSTHASPRVAAGAVVRAVRASVPRDGVRAHAWCDPPRPETREYSPG